jgi:tRNA synthetases class I (M)
VLKQATTVKKPQLSAKVLECEVDVGTVFNVAELAGSADLPDSSGAERERFYLTTAINYTNGNPHIGHAYEAITSDCISRYHRMYGRRVFFQTGTDEHGQKIANAAEAQGKQPIDLCDHYAGNFQVRYQCTAMQKYVLCVRLAASQSTGWSGKQVLCIMLAILKDLLRVNAL